MFLCVSMCIRICYAQAQSVNYKYLNIILQYFFVFRFCFIINISIKQRNQKKSNGIGFFVTQLLSVFVAFVYCLRNISSYLVQVAVSSFYFFFFCFCFCMFCFVLQFVSWSTARLKSTIRRRFWLLWSHCRCCRCWLR